MPRRRTEPSVISQSRARQAREVQPRFDAPAGAAQSARMPEYGMPCCDWALLSEPLQLAVAREALMRAAETIAGQAMVLAAEMDDGALPDRGGAEALRLFAAVVRVTGRERNAPAGHA